MSAGPEPAAARRSWTALIGPVLFTAGVAANLGGLALHAWQATGGDGPTGVHAFAAAFVAVNLAWLLAEIPITFRPPSAPPREVSTLVAYGCVRMATVAAAVLLPIPWSGLSAWAAVPVLVFAGGVLLRLVAMRVLGQFYSHHVIRRDDHVIVRTGPYRVIRHPAYTGMLLGHVGLVLFFLNPLSVPLLTALAVVIGWRIRVEERELMTIPAYQEYAAGRPRLLPWVW